MILVLKVLTSKVFWIVTGLCLIAGAGWYGKGVFEERARLKSELTLLKAARKAERDFQEASSQMEAHYVEKIKEERNLKDERIKVLESQLAKSGHALAGCRIDADTLRVLNHPGDVTGDSVPAGKPGPGPSTVEESSTCEALALTFEENRSAYNQTADQVQALRSFYKDIRIKYCAATGAC